MSHPAAASFWICATVATTSWVGVLVMDWMVTGAPPPTGTPPTLICLVIIYLPNSLPTSLRVTASIRHISAARPARWTYPSYLASIFFRKRL